MGKNRKKLLVFLPVASAGILLMVLALGGTASAQSLFDSPGNRPAGVLQQDGPVCFGFPGGRLPLAVPLVKLPFDCEFKLPETNLQITVAHDQRRTDPARVDDPNGTAKYLGGSFDRGFTYHMGSTSQDYAGAKFGAAYSMGILKPKVEFARFHNNVAGDPTASITSAGKVSVDARVPHWPVLTLAYGREFRENRAGPTGPTTAGVSTDAVSGTLWYGRSTWDAYVTSSYSSQQDRWNKDSRAIIYDYILGGSYRPIDSLSIHPSFEFSQTLDSQSDYRYEMLSANLGIYYSIRPESLILSLYSSFTAHQDSKEYVDTQSLSTYIGLAQHVGDVFGVPDDSAKLSFTLNYNRYADRVYEDADWEEYSALVLLEMNF